MNRILLSALMVLTFSLSALAADLSIPKGARRFVLPLAEAQAKGISSGDYVDVIVAMRQPLVGKEEGVSETVSAIDAAATLLQDKRVIRIISADKGFLGIELELNPKEAQYLVLALGFGKGVFLAVRAPGDHDVHPLENAHLNRFLR